MNRTTFPVSVTHGCMVFWPLLAFPTTLRGTHVGQQCPFAQFIGGARRDAVGQFPAVFPAGRVGVGGGRPRVSAAAAGGG